MSNLQGNGTLHGELTRGGSGTTDYEALSNKPKINNVELTGNKTTSDLGLFSGDYNDLSNKPTIHTYTAGNGITIENDVISATGGSASKVCLLKIHAYGMANETLTLTDEDENEVTIEVETNNEIVTFEIMNAGTYTLTNSKNLDEQTFNISIETSVVVGTVSSIVPVLSSNIGSNGTAIAPANNPNYEYGNAYLAFDNDFNTKLAYQGENQNGAYVGYIFTNNVYIDNIVAYMGNYQDWNNFPTKLQITYDGTTWETIATFNVTGTNDGSYNTYSNNVKKVCRGFRLLSDVEEKNANENWFTYQITCNGYEI